ncbi:MAG TPA: sugar O-acetyltransferase [Candidatus Aphodoplasma excrementigallinarum]|uniref:Sugar O-acetyltransferase n=1 Tax=Candidatus Aphodoplasma excrementigallinarum TaxID=2840673 RepID=A0A9D1NG45_9FIRM|nr:sugar O-acetyltransferase [Candidatus Aphodoplasma excrementigallinarum]
MDIFERDLAGEAISVQDPEFYKINAVIEQTQKLLAELNNSYHTKEEIQNIFSRLTGRQVDGSFELFAPFYTDFGRNIVVGKDVFINQNCTFMDRGGITLEDKVLIAPRVNLVTINHSIAPERRRDTESRPIHICKNVWIGTGATVMPGVTVGENAIIAAGSVVTKDIPPGVVAAGIPAKVIKEI